MDLRYLLLLGLCVAYVSCKSAQKLITPTKMLSGLEKYQEKYPLPKLPYKYNELEPYIDETTMKNHHLGIHAERTLTMNKKLAEWRASGKNDDLAKSSLFDILKNLEKIPQPFKEDLRNSIGGYLNHIFYFASLSPNPTGEERKISTSMERALKHSFLNFTNFQSHFNKSVDAVFSTGYVWLVRIPKYRYLTTYVGLQEANPIAIDYQPILCLDLWEHAYFTKYANNKEEYVRNWWKVVDFDNVEEMMNWWWSFEPKHDEL